MFEELFLLPYAIAGHRAGPFVTERERYLSHLKSQGSARNTLRTLAPMLLVLARDFNLPACAAMSALEISSKVDKWLRRKRKNVRSKGHKRAILIRAAVQWMGYLGQLTEELDPNLKKIEHLFPLLDRFAAHLTREREFSSATVENYGLIAIRFLVWLKGREIEIIDISFQNLDDYIGFEGEKWQRSSMRALINGLKAFLQFLEGNRLCKPTLSGVLKHPPQFRFQNVPAGPSWETVKELISKIDLTRSSGVRDRAILLLLAVYGLRSSEVVGLRLQDINWEEKTLTVYRPKSRRFQIYPLTDELGFAISEYLKKARPSCEHQQIFLTLCTPVSEIFLEVVDGIKMRRLVEEFV